MMKLAKTVITCFTLCVMLTACVVDDDVPMPQSHVNVGDRCPSIEFDLSASSLIEPASLRGARVSLPQEDTSAPTMLVFFNTECRDCQAELPVIGQVAEAHPTASFFCVARSEDEGAIEAYWRAHNLHLPFSPQPDASLFSVFATSGIPRIYVISPGGVITACFSDSPLPTFDELSAALTK